MIAISNLKSCILFSHFFTLMLIEKQVVFASFSTFIPSKSYLHQFHNSNTNNNYQYVPHSLSLNPTFKKPNTSAISTARRKSSLFMGLEVNIRIVGRKNGIEQWLQEAYEMYETRLSRDITVQTTFHKNNSDLIKGIKQDSNKGYGIVLLDEKGKAYTSQEFSEKVYDWLDIGGSRLVFVIGGADGLPPELKAYQYDYNYGGSSDGIFKTKPIFICLSLMTFTHQWARTILIEQIYRAAEIQKGSGYHKE
mmetsp:Transcript_21948/g.24980  ORF Transcript_21948/g.24980 Transcript_21948/m.24980 type:complete len:250 (+) Transcript_21948:13-762(+)